MGRRPLCVVLLLLAAGILFVHSRWESNCFDYDGEKITMICELEDIEGRENSYTILVRDVHSGQKKICHRMKLYTGEDTKMPGGLHIGNLLQVEASVYSFSKPGNPGQFDEYQYNTEQGISYKAFVSAITIKDPGRDWVEDGLYQLRCHFRQIIDECCQPEAAGIIAAMVLGDKSELSEETKKLYQENGIAHILAISGLHISMIGIGLFFFLRRFIMPMQMAAVVTLVLLFLYGILTGFSISTQRAVTMMSCMLFARLVGRPYDDLSAISLSAILQLCVHPFVLFQTGFLLSYGTVLGILLFVRRFQAVGGEMGIFSTAFWGSLGIQLVTLPILLSSYYEMPLYSVIANFLLLPLMGGILSASIGGMVLGSIRLFLGKFCFGFVHYCLFFFDSVCTILGSLPYHNIVTGKPFVWQIILYYTGMLFFCVLQKREYARRNLLFLLASLVILFLPVHHISGVEITNLDVGQGDCTCIRTEMGTVMVDGGSSDVKEAAKYRILPYLKSQGISSLDYIFVTHSDSDHTSGIQEILENVHSTGIRIGTLVLPKLEKKDAAYDELVSLCKKAGVPVAFMEKGDRMVWGEVVFSCLHPYASYEWETENNYSLVLQIRYRRFTGLLTGDLEAEGEKELQGEISHVTYLKVGHHGSKGASSEDFLQSVTPEVAVLSAGRKNRYGHPSPEVIKRLREVGAQEYCTIDKGAVTVQTDGYESEVRCYKP